MARWIAFDGQTAEAILSHSPGSVVAEIYSGEPLSFALDLATPSVLLRPSRTPGRVLVARITPKAQTPVHEPLSTTPMAFEASGILGLTDTPVLLDEVIQASPPRNKWWQRKKTT
jgi:hypothetical protein